MGKSVTSEQIYQELHGLKDELQTLKQVLQESQRGQLSTEHPHIIRMEGVRGGEPVVPGTGISVHTIVERFRLGETPEQIAGTYPVLTLAQVYAALSYYYDHPQEIEAYIAENEDALWKAPILPH
ncbi:MAG: DUF433 domain-containing protein [Ardenticatenaceae bacterium]|nr:DUF433 domain-containing protein [Ardenticatenaceae bacterium]